MTRVDARTVRVGLVADSHVGEYLDALPEWVFDALSGCDLILHAGDLSVVSVLGELEEIAPVRAVRGDHDRDADVLPESLVASVRGWRIGLIHGSWGPAWDAATVTRSRWWATGAGSAGSSRAAQPPRGGRRDRLRALAHSPYRRTTGRH